MTEPPEGYLGLEEQIRTGPSDALVDSGYRLEITDAALLHRGLGLADLSYLLELEDVGIVPPKDARALGGALLQILATPAEEFPYDPVYGDAYNSRERQLELRIGDAAGWLPTGRTRREAGRIAFRLALRTALLDLSDAVSGLAASLTSRAVELAAAVWNDTTYLQPAQPSTFGHFLAGFAEQATRDLDRIVIAHQRTNQSPAGVGGVAGTAIPVDRSRLSDSLGFDAPAAHTRDAMWSVDWLTDAVVAATQSVLTADRLAEDLEIFASPQFGYVRLAGSTSRASVMLPQKRNPYALAVIRGGAGTLIGRTTGVMATQRTPSARTDNWLYAYGEVAGSVDLARRLITLATEVVTNLEVDRAALAASAGAGFSIAADLTERLVIDTGITYRSGYRLVGRAVRDAIEAGRDRLDPSDLVSAAQSAGAEVDPQTLRTALEMVADAGAVALARDTPGGSAPSQVEALCMSIDQRIMAARTWSEQARAATSAAENQVVEEATNRWVR